MFKALRHHISLWILFNKLENVDVAQKLPYDDNREETFNRLFNSMRWRNRKISKIFHRTKYLTWNPIDLLTCWSASSVNPSILPLFGLNFHRIDVFELISMIWLHKMHAIAKNRITSPRYINTISPLFNVFIIRYTFDLRLVVHSGMLPKIEFV